VSYPTGCYNRAQNLRMRPLKEMKSCVVFRPDPPKLFMLNLNAWLILELCDGRTTGELEQGYCASVASQMSEADARTNLETGLQKLHEQGLIVLGQDKH
jgi:hypothetical protein